MLTGSMSSSHLRRRVNGVDLGSKARRDLFAIYFDLVKVVDTPDVGGKLIGYNFDPANSFVLLEPAIDALDLPPQRCDDFSLRQSCYIMVERFGNPLAVWMYQR